MSQRKREKCKSKQPILLQSANSHRVLSSFFLVSNYPKISLKTQENKGEDSRIGKQDYFQVSWGCFCLEGGGEITHTIVGTHGF